MNSQSVISFKYIGIDCLERKLVERPEGTKGNEEQAKGKSDENLSPR